MSRAAPWLVAVALAALFTAFQIQSSLHSGALALPLTYDDVVYLNRALARLSILYREGGWAFAADLWHHPFHAPVQETLAMLGFVLFGAHRVAPYAMNTIPLALLIRLFLRYSAKSTSLTTSAVLSAALLGFPLLGLLVVEFRPDMLCALLTAAGALVIVCDRTWRDGEKASLAIVVALFVGALLSKPTLAPVTVFVFTVATAATVALQATSLQEAKLMALRALASGAIGLLIALPYYASNFKGLAQYIWGNAFGAGASVWRPNLNWSEHLLYYLTGQSGKVAVGLAWLSLLCGLAAAALPTVLRPHRKAVFATFALVAAAYLSVTAPSMKSPFIGLIVPAFVLGLVAILSIVLLGSRPKSVAMMAAIALLTFSAVVWRPVYFRQTGSFVQPAQSQAFTRILAQTVDALATVPELERRKLYFPVIAQYLNEENIGFEFLRRGLNLPEQGQPGFYDDIAHHRAIINQADVVILLSDDSTLPISWLASMRIRKQINAEVNASGMFENIATIEGGAYGRVFVLRRK